MAGGQRCIAGRLELRWALDAPELLAEPVRVALVTLPAELVLRCAVAEMVVAECLGFSA